MRNKWQIFLERFAPYGVFIFVIFLYFLGAQAHDLLSDDALYSFRSLGWFDYVGGVLQTTPIQWFGSVPWWGNFSFHDAPPLVFAFQFLFFSVFGMSILAAKAPFALAGAAVILVLSAIFSEWRNRKAAFIAAAFIAVSSYAAWVSLAGFLESFEVFFLILSTFFFLRYLRQDTFFNACVWGSALGLALLSKYTAIFFLAGIFCYTFVWKRGLFVRKSFWFAMVCMILVLIPVIIYNANVFVTRGHFDAALSSMVGMHPDDFKIIAGRSINTDFIGNTATLFTVMSGMISPLFFLLMISGVIFLFIKVIRKKGDVLDNFLFCTLLFAFLMFMFMGASERFLYVIIPFVISAAVVFIGDFMAYLRQRLPQAIPYVFALVFLVIGFELFFTINANILARPLSANPLFTQNTRLQSFGFNDLGMYIRGAIYPGVYEFKRPHVLEEINTLEKKSFNENILLFNETMLWAPYVWYIQPYSMYYRLPVISLTNYLQIIPEDSDPLEMLARTGAPGMYYINGVSDDVVDPVKGENDAMRSLERAFAEYLEKNGFLDTEIRGPSGDIAFKIYHVVFTKNGVVE